MFKWIFVLFLLPQVLWASKEVGNGGDVLVCSEKGAESVRFYDYAEEKNMVVAKLAAEPVAQVEALLQRLKSYDPQRAELYLRWLSQFMSEAKFIEGAKLANIADSGFGLVPMNCRLEQLAVQLPEPEEGKRYFIAKTFYDRLSSEDQAGLILHELIYRELALWQYKSSRNIRKFNRLVSSKGFAEMANHQYRTQVNKLKLPVVTTERCRHDFCP